MALAAYLASDETNSPHELVYGLLREPAAPSWSHQIVVGRVFVRLERHVSQRRLGRVIQSPVDVVLDRERALVVQPDVVFISSQRVEICTDRIWGAPDLVVEVLSMGTRRHDSTTKLAWYEKYGVRECWLIDPIAEELEVISLGKPRASRVHTAEQIAQSHVLPQLRLRVSDLFRRA